MLDEKILQMPDGYYASKSYALKIITELVVIDILFLLEL
jgi:hypothetical protein